MELTNTLLSPLHNVLTKHSGSFYPVVPFDPGKDKLLRMNFTAVNNSLTEDLLADTEAFSAYINKELGSKYKYGIGGYAEHRTIYSRSTCFDGVDEPRRFHLGIDIWGPAGTPVFAPLDGYVHSFAYNNHFGDYGATIILHHQLDGISFNTLYGHLSIKDIEGIKEGEYIKKGNLLAHFGEPLENGHWPPHLHFQVISEMFEMKGDFHGVCKYSEREIHLSNCPDADLILKMMQYAV